MRNGFGCSFRSGLAFFPSALGRFCRRRFVRHSAVFVGGKKASVIPEKCTGCGRCAEVCNFDAPHPRGGADGLVEKTYVINSIDCEGCGVCSFFCPYDAIVFKDVVNGRWFVSDTRFGPFVHARLRPAEENSGRLVGSEDRSTEIAVMPLRISEPK